MSDTLKPELGRLATRQISATHGFPKQRRNTTTAIPAACGGTVAGPVISEKQKGGRREVAKFDVWVHPKDTM